MVRPTNSSAVKVALGFATASVALIGAVGLLLAVMASRPKLLRALGWVSTERQSPAQFGLPFEDVEYRPGVRGWWIPAQDAIGSVVIVHGLETSDDPRSTDPGPRLEIAAALLDVGYSSLVINLGYATGTHPYSAGALEAEDIATAVAWVHGRGGSPVALIGMSAGGHAAVTAAVAAAREACEVFAVVTDGSFVDGAEVIIDQAANLHPHLRLPARIVPSVMGLMSGSPPVDLGAADDARSPAPQVPMLHIHGAADTAISPSNAGRLAEITGGKVWIVPGADHVGSYEAQPTEYRARVLDFLARHHPA